MIERIYQICDVFMQILSPEYPCDNIFISVIKSYQLFGR